MMLYQFIRQESEGDRWRFILAAILSAVANTSVLAIISMGLHAHGHLNVGLWILFVVICVGYAVSYRYCVTTITRRVEAALYKVRLRLGEKIRRAELMTIEQIGAPQIFDQIVQQTTIISNSSWLIALGLQAFVLMVMLLVYVLFLSQVLLLLFVLAALVVVPLYYVRSQRVTASMRHVNALQVALHGLLNDLLRGFKETRLHTRRGSELYAHFDETAAALKDGTIELHRLDQENVNFMHLNVYVLLAATVFILPLFIRTTSHSLSELSAAALFLTGPIGILSFTIPEYERANLAATRIHALEERLDQAAQGLPPHGPPHGIDDPFAGHFNVIEADQLCFSYTDPRGGEGFALGPISLSLRAGEIVFFVGGNGSGKTTLLKLLTGLYAPTSGRLLVDQRLVEPSNLQAYRELVAAIFTDFYLFKKLYGLADRTAEQVKSLLRQLQIAGKTAYGPEGFTNLELSTGQRKRLAMVVALLEDRPVYVFDEWAADQDPEFRRYYYEELLPELKRRGKTVLAISHDDRYFHCADRVVFMEYGAIRAIDDHPGKPVP